MSFPSRVEILDPLGGNGDGDVVDVILCWPTCQAVSPIVDGYWPVAIEFLRRRLICRSRRPAERRDRRARLVNLDGIAIEIGVGEQRGRRLKSMMVKKSLP